VRQTSHTRQNIDVVIGTKLPRFIGELLTVTSKAIA